ncbi:hypothetical protein GO491_07045 [Flavobacteriaceae bacterium Ap0902]|nr:hypothetical protein [Flavobacteriaceae bacterium Ap0902]
MNGDFNKGIDSWFLSDSTSIKLVNNYNNKYLQLNTNEPNDFIYAAQSFYPQDSLFELKYKTKYTPFSDSNAGVWVKAIDSLNSNIYFYVEDIIPSHKWQTSNINFKVPKQTKRIQIGVRLSGIGNLYIDDINTRTVSVNQNIDKQTENYLKKLKFIIENNALNRDSINWNIEWRHALKYSKFTPDKYYLSAKYLLSKLNDNHSYLSINPKHSSTPKDDYKTKIINKKITDEIAYIKIPPFSSSNSTHIDSLFYDIQGSLKSLDSNSVKYWVIDLRGNYGGNVWPMLGGLISFFEEGVLGYFEYYDKSRKPWIYKDDSLLKDSELSYKLPTKPYKLKNPKSHIGVLVDNSVASSAEMLTIIFKPLPNSKIIGKQTWGATTGNSTFKMDDYTDLHLATSRLLDINGKFENKICPDIVTDEIILNAANIKSWFD